MPISEKIITIKEIYYIKHKLLFVVTKIPKVNLSYLQFVCSKKFLKLIIKPKSPKFCLVYCHFHCIVQTFFIYIS